jgi:hypothetical protein
MYRNKENKYSDVNFNRTRYKFKGQGKMIRVRKFFKLQTTHSDNKQIKTNSEAWVREWTISTERPPLVGQVSANFCG